MKKRIAGVTAAMMVVAAIAAPAVFAEETEAGLGLVNTSDEPVVFDYHDVDDSVFEGQWWDTGLGFDLCLPADWIDNDLTEEMTEAGVVHIYGEEGAVPTAPSCIRLFRRKWQTPMISISWDRNWLHPIPQSCMRI